MFKKLSGTINNPIISVGCSALHPKQRHREAHSAVAIHHATQRILLQSTGLPRCACGFARNDGKRLIPLLCFLILLLLSAFPAAAQTNGHRMKFVFPFGEEAKKSICPVNYRTLDGCCEPPNSIYTHSKRIGCCRPPNLPLIVGTNTRCCVSEGVGQSRFGQTETSPCGQFCNTGTEGYYIDNDACLFKDRPNDYCSWTVGQWQCSACYRNGVFYAAGTCTFNGASANATCTAKEALVGGGNYLCARRDGGTQMGPYDCWGGSEHIITANGVTVCGRLTVQSVLPCDGMMDAYCCQAVVVYDGCTGTGIGNCITTTNPTYRNGSAYCADAQCKTFNPAVTYYSCSTSIWYH